MLKVAEQEEATTSPSPAEETRSLVEEPELWEEWPTVAQAPDYLEEALEPKGASSLGVMTIAQRQLLLAPPGFRELLAAKSGPPPLEDADSPLGIPWELS